MPSAEPPPEEQKSAASLSSANMPSAEPPPEEQNFRYVAFGMSFTGDLERDTLLI